jgi:aspartate/methionine/tyrosine aminotransferase
VTAALDPLLESDAVIQRDSPALWEALSPVGRRVRQPANFLPLQSAEARGKPFNATIGQITDGHGKAVPLPSMAAAVSGLDEARRSQGFLYSPVEGIADLRQAWRDRQRQRVAADRPSALPIVTMGPAQALALAAELFVTEGRPVVLPEPVDEVARELFEVRCGGRIVAAAFRADGSFDPAAAARAVAALPETSPVVVVLRFRHAPNSKRQGAVRASLAAAAEHRPVVVIVDDSGLAEPGASLFWGLIGKHPRLIPVLVDGADALGFPGGRVGFLTFPFEPGSDLFKAIESKAKMLLRAAVGSPSAMSQVLLREALAGQP